MCNIYYLFLQLQENPGLISGSLLERIFTVEIIGGNDLSIIGSKSPDQTHSLILNGVDDFNVIPVLPFSRSKLLSNQVII